VRQPECGTLLGQRRVPTVTVTDTVIVIVIVIVYTRVISTTKDDLVRVQPAVTQPGRFLQLVGTHGQETLESRVGVPIRDVRV